MSSIVLGHFVKNEGGREYGNQKEHLVTKELASTESSSTGGVMGEVGPRAGGKLESIFVKASLKKGRR